MSDEPIGASETAACRAEEGQVTPGFGLVPGLPESRAETTPTLEEVPMPTPDATLAEEARAYQEGLSRAPDASGAERARFRPLRAPVRVKHVTFEGEGGLDLARTIENKAWLEGRRAATHGLPPIHVNDVILRLLRRGLQAEESST